MSEKSRQVLDGVIYVAGIAALLLLVVAVAARVPELAAIGAVVALLFAAIRWYRRRERSANDGRTARMEDRLAQLDMLQDRLLELEERVDFAERLLAQRRESDAIAPGYEELR